SAGAPAVAGAVFARAQLLGDGQTHAGGDLLRAQEIFVRGVLEALALERDDALVAGGIRPLVDGHGEMPAAKQRAAVGGARGNGGIDARGIEAGAAADVARRGVV